ncbi:helix-turn-helix domain-containing protein [Burkholderia ubonensis]|uniref:helix-turn-helix domain-containing protein n=1 Tax=Burkholderia ubonensis TaxID=101571 RepID=UPI000BA4F88D|nr:helix-turn-helix transcriptional regulator [Burkholderia ubonensis]PAJ93381.1 XRE family transcriptional regulator [Burkholderia ubonensis]PAK12160.1 XRE family transcriptional regulator [Burkholderia ubonensis]RQP31445.1 XRE family transcriptional regulator [Burkholderia ubonensis]RQP34238.1 XRE family transcriptional regulator [Burkholderia ubonensis]RQP37404.1 XRE family transcriptional regulator [Burkholderia ubonensis]
MPAPLKGPDPNQRLVSLRDVLAFNVRVVRVRNMLSQEQLGFAADLDRTFISQVERARINVSLDNIERIARALGVAAHILLQRPDETPAAETPLKQ